MKHLLILITLTCYSHASAEDNSTMSKVQLSDQSKTVVISHITNSVFSRSYQNNGISISQESKIWNRFHVIAYVCNSAGNCQDAVLKDNDCIADDKRISSCDYNQSVLKEQLSSIKKNRTKTNF